MRDFWEGKRVLVTGHTGFKGLWLAKWLDMVGASVAGYSLPPDQYSLYWKLAFSGRFQNNFGDVRDADSLRKTVCSFKPEIVFHLAAHAIVREAWLDPAGAFSSNVMGTVNLLEVLRGLTSLKAVVVVTSDKVYENVETNRPYTEADRLGGDEPYAASKAAAELAVSAYRNAYFKSGPGVATARASNVYGGGDMHFDRLIPHLIRAKISGEPAELRNPDSVRPWQYILDPLNGYISLARHLYGNPVKFSGCWNFGPPEGELCTVGEIFSLLLGGKSTARRTEENFYEAGLLLLDSKKSMSGLGWRPVVNLETGLSECVSFYRGLFGGEDATALMESEISRYMKKLGA
ncbi:MAG: CDP-glucose 4,6-dehydratase [Synergistaceae bacterium]|jgi:CDP-glucose 4,6-dehydratase|nr:CDP-glucose 4,6-dehydratase [Synergistaceae bacterium]